MFIYLIINYMSLNNIYLLLYGCTTKYACSKNEKPCNINYYKIFIFLIPIRYNLVESLN